MTQLDAALAKIDELIAALRSGALFSTAAPGQATQPANAPPTVKAKQPKKANKPAAKPASAAVAADTDAFDKAQLAIGRVKSVSDHPSGSEKLWLCKVDVGDGNERQVVAGLRLHVTSEELTGRLVVVVLNLKPAKLAGELSEAMILASEHQPEGGDALVRVLSVADGSQPGDVVFRQGCEAPAGYPKECKSKLWREVVEGLAVSGGTACYKGTPLMTVCGPLLVADVPDGAGIR